MTSGWPPLFTFSGRENPLASHPLWLGSARQPNSLSLSIRSHSPPPALPPYAATTPRCTLLHQPSPRPGVFSPLYRQVRVDLGPALNRPSLQPPPDSALTLAIPRPFVPSFPPPLLLHPRYRRRRRRLLRTSPHPNPHLEDTSTLETPVSIGRSNARERHLKPPSPLSLSFSATDHP